ncbi:CpaF family protein [Acetobacter fallax]|uniref:CpaF family protein n=1 Tax=Acetobacter fallax TaxID=1737473 RepID=A0ABX0KD71_9PROT|nr:CpaF family protein [Acetobacter fallax]NHO33627.1 CpaF family protein [Acetobacter fallax]NHO37214.1 CpaF family protein [Acetobacter fallax]
MSSSFGKKTISTQPPIDTVHNNTIHHTVEVVAQSAELHGFCLERLDPAAINKLPPERLMLEIERVVNEIANEKRVQLNAREQKSLANDLVNDMLGLGPIQPLLDDDQITDIMVNGPYRVFVEKYGKLIDAKVNFRDKRHLMAVSQRIASAVGRRIDESSPTVDARLSDGSRVNIVFPPLALDGPYVSIRKFSKKKIDFKKLVENGSCSVQIARILEIASRVRLNVIISGGTGSGKTTLMNAMSRLIDPGERVITVEDAAELQFQQPHVVRLETRPPSIEGTGEITQRDLVKNALRMRPDRIIIGEVRGAEAFDMLQAMNTGHDGSMSTIHANSTRDAITRIENMVQMGNLGLPVASIRTQIVGAVDLIVQIERQRDGVRRIVQVTDVAGLEGDVVTLNDIITFNIDGENHDGKIVGHYNVSRARPSFHSTLTYFQLDKVWVNALGD